MTETRIKYPFWVKLLLYGLVLALVPATIVGYKSVNENAGLTKKDNLDFRLAIAEDLANSVSSTLLESSNTLVAIAQAFGDANSTYDEKEKIARLFVESNELLDHAIFFDQSGKYLDTMSQDKSNFKAPAITLDENIRKNAGEKEVVFKLLPIENSDVNRVFTLVPIRTNDKVTHYVGSFVPLTRIQNRIAHLSDRITNFQGSVYIVAADLRYVAHPDESYVNEKKSVPSNTLLTNLDSALSDGVAQSGEFVNSIGEEKIGSMKPLTIVPWTVIVETSKEEVYASFYNMQKIVGITILIAGLFALLAAILTSRFLSASISKLVAYSKHIANREFDADLDVDSKDEIGVLADAMRFTASSLKSSEEELKKEVEIRSDLGRYLPQEIVDGIVDRNFDLKLGGEKQNITVLFADVVSFTQVCETNDPEVIVKILNELFTILTEVVFQYNGTVDKFIGDCVMAFWGAPSARPNHAVEAIEAAEEMMRFVEIGSERWRKEYGVDMKLAIGIHTGDAVVGNIGSSTRMEYTAIGSTVNIAARLEALARPGQILTTNITRETVGSSFDFLPLDAETITSGGNTVKVFEVVI